MFVCTPDTLGTRLSPWGKEVVRILAERKMLHKELLQTLEQRGLCIHKATFAQLLKGIGIRGRENIIHEVNVILDIPEVVGRPA